MKRGLAVVAVALAALATTASAAIVGTSGQVTQIAPPASVKIDALESNTTMYAFDEQQGVTLQSGLEVDITTPGTYDDTSDLTPGTIPAGTLVNSDFVNSDRVGDDKPPVQLDGTVTTSSDILGIIITQHHLNLSDYLGAPGTLYPTGDFGRALNLDSQNDFVIEQIDKRTVEIHSQVALHNDQVRIITKAAAPPRQDLTVSKTATPSFDLKYKWTIDKSVDNTKITKTGGTATFNYKVDVSHDAGTASNWQVTGKITVSNPNASLAITLDSLDDAIDNGGSCSIDTSGGLTIPAGGSKDYPYTCTYASAPSPAGFTNSATAKWNAATYNTPNGSASGNAGGAFGNPTNVIDECVSVSDPIDPNSPRNFCVGDVGDPNFSFTYARTVNVPSSGCVSYDNTATFTTKDTSATGSDKVTVQVCGPVTHGKTQGFWGNKNGQALLVANNAFSPAKAVELGVSGLCYVKVDSQAKSQQILPNTKDGIGLTGCSGLLDAGVNANSFNNLLSQTLALSYNILYKGGYAGQTLGSLGCAGVGPLTSSSTVEQARAYANYLIGNAKKNAGAAITQSQIGDMNGLLGDCVNTEA